MIELKEVTKKFNTGKPNELVALDSINLTIQSGEMLAIMGRSGAGKSTLLHIIGCLDNVTSGSYIIDGHVGRAKAARSARAGTCQQPFPTALRRAYRGARQQNGGADYGTDFTSQQERGNGYYRDP